MLKLFIASFVLWQVAAAAVAQDNTAAQEQPATSPTDAAQPQTDSSADQVAAAQQPASSEAAEAKSRFDAAVKNFNELVGKIEKHRQDRAAAEGDARKQLDGEVAGLRKNADELISEIGDSALAVFRAAPDAHPDVNSTLLAIIQHHLAGDANGDGGDQYEKALPLIRGMMEAGGTEKFPELWLWAAVSAYASNDFDAAKDYFDKAADAGQLEAAPSDRSSPAARIFELANQFRGGLDRATKAWEKEKQIRDAEAKADDLPRVKLTTTQGDIVIELFENEAPESVANFITLVKQGFYNDVVFHRVLPGFMAQGGDPTGTGSGGPGYSIRCECYKPEFRRHFRGSLSMAHAGRDTGGSQFFLTFIPTSFLDGRHTAFGRVVEGMDVAAALKRIDPESPGKPVPDRILKAEVLRDRGHEYTFQKLPGR